MADEATVRQDAIHLYTFLKEFTELRTQTIRTLESYDHVLWLSEIPRQRECACAAWTRGSTEEHEDWIEVQKPRIASVPEPPPALAPWLSPAQLQDTSVDVPALRTEVAVEVTDEEGNVRIETQRLQDHPEIKPLWERYVEQLWWPWREERRRVDPIQAVYTTLFSIYQKQQRLGEQYEVVLGLGLLSWRLPTGHVVRRHLVIAHAQITFDPQRGVISVSPGVEGAGPILEQDMLDPQHRPAPEELKALTDEVEAIGDEVWDSVRVDAVLRGWVQSASPRGTYQPLLQPTEHAGDDPHVQLSPALVLRQRTDRSFLRAFDDIITQVKAGEPVPAGVGQFVTAPSEAAESDDVTCGLGTPVDGETYFPLEANDAQRRIVERLATNPGVLVQGPPGTGKSHTIVNLICHLLATGQRVLVTSHTARALAVLQRYIRDRVPEIAPLAVVLLGEGREALQAMEDSVHGITSRQHTWDPDAASRRIADLTKQLDEARRQQAEALAALRAVRERETYVHPVTFASYRGTLTEIARRLRAESNEFEWVRVRPSETEAPPLSNTEVAELLGLLRDPAVRHAEAACEEPPDPSGWLRPADFAELASAEVHAKAASSADEATRRLPACRALMGAPVELRTELRGRLRTLLAHVESLDRHLHKWVSKAAHQILGGHDRPWRELLETTQAHLKAIGNRARWADELGVRGLGQRDQQEVRADAEALLHHIEGGGGWGFFGLLRPAPAKRGLYLRNEARVKGRPCETVAALRDLLTWLDIKERLGHLRKLWGQEAVAGGSFAASAAAFANLCEPLKAALDLHAQILELQKAIASVPSLPEPTWHEPASLMQYLGCLEVASRDEALKLLRQRFQAGRPSWAAPSGASAYVADLRGLVSAFDQRDTARYGEIVEHLASLRHAWQSLQRKTHLLQVLAKAAPDLAQDLARSVEDDVWDGRAACFEAAWRWAQAAAWVERLCDPKAEAQMRLRLDGARDRVRRRFGEIAAEKAWLHCFGRMTEHERQHLVAWSQAVRRVGRGAGRFAPLHRRHAREHMNECRGAIPAWVLPLYRVAETMRVGRDLFDVAIIDEASQSGPEALLLAYMARKLVVVGDDKQISPSYVGLNRDDVLHLRQRHIATIPHADAYGVDESFFSLSEIHYRGRIRLREHFRCMPEIIQFSNNLCYQGEPLVPLRQYGSDRLAPVVEARHVEGGYQSGTGSRQVNIPEAEAVAAEIARCVHDDRYRKKTIGVISLLGEHQAREVEKRLLATVGPEEMERRQIVCGDAYAFQGDERDVIFLSLVSAPTEGRRIGVLTSEADKRRFNVAASRARDQMVLYHSANLDDLGTTCLRRELLQYCLEPTVHSPHIEGLAIPQIRQLAASADRAVIEPPEPFGSWFEVDVFLRIAGRGYRVIPQFEVAGYRIDLVVEGMRTRLAVECDGDRWHGPERYDEDMGRQRDLERCGWTFWRVRSSAFALDPEGALEGLWDALRRAEVWPSGAAAPPADGGPSIRAIPQSAAGGETDRPRSTRLQMDEDSQTEAPTSGEDDFVATEIGAANGRGDVEVLNPGADPRLLDRVYEEWHASRLPDPKDVPITELVPGLVEIVKAEGPLPAHRACQIFVKAAGHQRVGKEYKRILYTALRRAINHRLLEARSEEKDSGPAMQVLRVAGSPPAVVRPRGPRLFSEIPASEIAAVMCRLEATVDGPPGVSELWRAVLTFYDTKRMTAQIEARLRWIYEHRDHLSPSETQKSPPARLM